MKEKEYEKPQILETMHIEEILMDEELAPEWINWKQDWNNWPNWNNSWNNTSIAPQEIGKSTEGVKIDEGKEV